MRAVAAVLPFRVNTYVLDELIDWSAVPDDPIFRLTFPQREMLAPGDFDAVHRLVREDAPAARIEAEAQRVRTGLNPHPGGQRELNVPSFDGRPLAGAQHKYADTLLAFPAEAQTCHAYCAYCFRWAQFAGPRELRFAHSDPERIAAYVRSDRRITDVLLTGGDPLVARSAVLRRHIAPLLEPDLERVNIRIGTKAPAYWPERFLGDRDAAGLLRLFEDVVAAGRHLALMVHFSHPRELETESARRALSRILATGATVRCQAPVVRHVNDSAATWARLWSLEVRAGLIPYYMFVERDTGPRRYFELPLARALEIYEGATAAVSGLARTARGPVMSSEHGKVLVAGTVELPAGLAFVLKLIRARDPGRLNETSFARYDPAAAWVDQLRPVETATPSGGEPVANGNRPAAQAARR
jgi:L-lysine 2,3-aminomutase